MKCWLKSTRIRRIIDERTLEKAPSAPMTRRVGTRFVWPAFLKSTVSTPALDTRVTLALKKMVTLGSFSASSNSKWLRKLRDTELMCWDPVP